MASILTARSLFTAIVVKVEKRSSWLRARQAGAEFGICALPVGRKTAADAASISLRRAAISGVSGRAEMQASSKRGKNEIRSADLGFRFSRIV